MKFGGEVGAASSSMQISHLSGGGGGGGSMPGSRKDDGEVVDVVVEGEVLLVSARMRLSFGDLSSAWALGATAVAVRVQLAPVVL